MNEIKTLFPGSGWKLKMRKQGERVEIALYWRDKPVPTHTAAVDVADLLELLGYDP